MAADTRWWRRSVGYEIYLRSFQDSPPLEWADGGAAFKQTFPDEAQAVARGDGIGDIPGLRRRLEYLEWLGVDLLWVTPFYPSPGHDQGYDVSDYTDVDPRYGTLADLDALLAEARQRGMRVIGDLVPNHSSSEHPWFVQARSSRHNPYRDYYVWREPAPDGGPPNNWASHFGGPAWTLDEETGQYWLHLFLPTQPDLNWANPAVAEAFDDILRFWLDRGLDGFRIDVAHGLVKHPEFLDNPPARSRRDESITSGGGFADLEHVYDLHQPGVLEVYRRWRRVVEPYGGLLVGEVYQLDARKLSAYVSRGDGLHLAFWFRPLHIPWSAAAVRTVLTDAAEAAPDGLAWVQASHDRSRPATRFGGGQPGRERALLLAVLLFGLPGVPFLYQGEELGLEDGVVSPEEAHDPIFVRDGCRTPMPWGGGGFTEAPRPWLPVSADAGQTVTEQRRVPGSLLHRYRRLVQLRRSEPVLAGGSPEWVSSDGPVVAYQCGRGAVVAGNCGDAAAEIGIPRGTFRVVFSTNPNREGSTATGALALGPREAVILRG